MCTVRIEEQWEKMYNVADEIIDRSTKYFAIKTGASHWRTYVHFQWVNFRRCWRFYLIKLLCQHIYKYLLWSKEVSNIINGWMVGSERCDDSAITIFKIRNVWSILKYNNNIRRRFDKLYSIYYLWSLL